MCYDYVIQYNNLKGQTYCGKISQSSIPFGTLQLYNHYYYTELTFSTQLTTTQTANLLSACI